MKLLLNLIFGALIGVSGTFLHNAYRPFGVVVSLLALVIGLRLNGNMYKSKLLQFIFVLGWIFVVVRASALGNGGEILIEANLYGNLFVFGGLGISFIALLRRFKF
ncbi:MAG: hypothetical protein RL733_629 [Actinomycetota bacterium]